MDLEQYPPTGQATRYGMIFSLAVDWIKGRPELFSFTLPKFHGGTVYGRTVQDYGEEIKAHRVTTGFYAINIPAVGIVIELQCEAEFANHVGESTGGESQLRHDEGYTTPDQPQYVTLDQISAIAGRSKNTAEKCEIRDISDLAFENR